MKTATGWFLRKGADGDQEDQRRGDRSDMNWRARRAADRGIGNRQMMQRLDESRGKSGMLVKSLWIGGLMLARSRRGLSAVLRGIVLAALP